MISRLGRLLAETGTATPQAILEQATRPGRSAGTLARALEDFFTDAGLAFPADHAARREAARRQRRVEETPEPLRPAVARYAAALTTAQQRARRAGTRPRADRTLAGDLAVLRDLARFLARAGPRPTGPPSRLPTWRHSSPVRPASRARRLTTLRSFFRWARASRLILANPAAGIRAGRPRGYHPRTLAVAEQRRLFRRWTTDPAVHPHEALAGLLALLHAAPSQDLRNLKVTDIDADRAHDQARTPAAPRPARPGQLARAATLPGAPGAARHPQPARDRHDSHQDPAHRRHRTSTWSGCWIRRASEPGPCGQPGLSISSPAWTPSSSARPSAWTPPASCPTPLTRSKTSGSPTCELQAPPCTR